MTTTTAIEIALNMASFIDFNLMFLPFKADVGTNNGHHGTSIFGLSRQVVALHRSLSTRLVQLGPGVVAIIIRLLLYLTAPFMFLIFFQLGGAPSTV